MSLHDIVSALSAIEDLQWVYPSATTPHKHIAAGSAAHGCTLSTAQRPYPEGGAYQVSPLHALARGMRGHQLHPLPSSG